MGGDDDITGPHQSSQGIKHHTVTLFIKLSKENMSESGEAAVRPSLLRRHSSSDHVVSIDESGLHVNHLEGHQQHLEGAFGSTHTYESEEAEAFAVFINSVLKDDEGLEHLLPLDPATNDIFSKHEDGLILLKLLNHAIPGCLDQKHINAHRRGSSLNVFKKNENINYFLKVAHEEGCNFVNIGANDIASGKEIAILSILWQLFRMQLLANITIKNFPELSVLLRPEETMAEFLLRSPEYILLRWMKYHFECDGEKFTCVNFGTSMKDPYVFAKVLFHIDESLTFDRGSPDDLGAKAELAKQAIANAHTMGVRSTTISTDLLSSAASVKIAFAAQIFNFRHGLPSVSEEVISAARALPDPPGMHRRKKTDADRAEQEAREEALREELMSIINKALNLSDEAAKLASAAELNASAARAAAVSAEADFNALKSVDGSNDSLAEQLLQDVKITADVAFQNYESCANAAEKIRSTYEEAAVCMEVSDAAACFAACESHMGDAVTSAADCLTNREKADTLADNMKRLLAKKKCQSCFSKCNGLVVECEGLLKEVQALDVSDASVREAVDSIAASLSTCNNSAQDINNSIAIFDDAALTSTAATNASESAETYLRNSEAAVESAKSNAEKARFAAMKASTDRKAALLITFCRKYLKKIDEYVQNSSSVEYVTNEINELINAINNCKSSSQAAIDKAVEIAATILQAVSETELSAISSQLEEIKQSLAAEEAAARAHHERIHQIQASERARLDAEAVERARLEAEAAERARLEAEAAERARLEAEAAERARLEAEAAEKARLEAEAAERARLEAEAAERARLEAEAAERARLEAEAAEKARLEAEAAERARLEAEAAERARLEAANKSNVGVSPDTVQSNNSSNEDGQYNLSEPLLSVPTSDNAPKSWWSRCCFCCYYR